MVYETVSHGIDVVNVVIVGRQRHGATEGGSVDRCIVGLEVGPEIAYGSLEFEDGPEGLVLVTRGVDRGALQHLQDLLVRHHHLRVRRTKSSAHGAGWPGTRGNRWSLFLYENRSSQNRRLISGDNIKIALGLSKTH
jgi:hypothetical protein